MGGEGRGGGCARRGGTILRDRAIINGGGLRRGRSRRPEESKGQGKGQDLRDNNIALERPIDGSSV